jgi:hypothetical protein
MTTTERPVAAPRTARLARRSRRGLILNLTAPQAITLFVAVVLVAAAVPTLGLAAAFWVAMLVGGPMVAVALVRWDGFPLVEWSPILWHYWRRRRTRQNGFRATATPRTAGRLALPGQEARLLTLTDPDGSVTVHDPWTGGYTAVLRVRAPAFLLLDPETQDAQVSGWGRVLAGICQSNLISRIQVLEQCVPDSGDGLRDYHAQHAHGLDLSEWAAENYRDLMDIAGPASSRSDVLLALTLDSKRCRGLVRKSGGGHTGALKVLAGQRRVVEAALAASSLAVEGWLTPAELAYELRCAYDPAIRPMLDYRPTAGRDLASAGPFAVQEHWDYLRTDTAYHCVLWLIEWPRSLVYPTFLAPLVLTPGIDRRLSLIYEPVPTAKAMKQVQHDKTELISNAHDRHRLGQVVNLADADELTDTLQREAEINAGHGDIGYAGLLVVSAPTLDQLTLAVGAVRQAAIQAGCEARVLAGQQMQAFAAAALPLTRGF